MGKTLVIYKVYPEEMEQVNEVEKGLREKTFSKGELKDLKVEDIGFGVKLFKIAILFNDTKNGELEATEKELKAVSNVKEIEVEGMNLL
ncbi:MAG: hypothetical protein ABH821_01105 [archaeon]